MLESAVHQALLEHELKFWEELHDVEGTDSCVFWAKLIGIFDPEIRDILLALDKRAKGDSSLWVKFTCIASSPPPLPSWIDFTSDDMTGFVQLFDGAPRG
jgi:hypothetical protein